MTILGNYDISWQNLSSFKCFFKVNPTDFSGKSRQIDCHLALQAARPEDFFYGGD